jgi:hypothetical protein
MTGTSSRMPLLFLLSQGPRPCEAPTLPAFHSMDVLEGRWQSAASGLASQWRNPTDVLTILLIIGGDIVQKALAQLCGDCFVPVAFSFGWVSYSFHALLALFGDGALMPATVCPSTLINARSGYARLNYSWVLNRLLRGVEHSLEPHDAALRVSVFRSKPHTGRASRDWLWWSGVLTIFIQLTVAAVPCAIESDWTILFVTVTGISLALSGGCLPQWRKEKWGARLQDKNTTFCLTRGNGFQHVVVIQNQSPGCLNLEDLAMPPRYDCPRSCKAAITILALLWIIFLITVAGIRTNTWYLLGVGLVGMAQNISVAAIPRPPDAMGLPLDFVTRIQGPKVMSVLMNTERQFPSVGVALVKTFFPGEFSDEEKEYWTKRAEETMPSSRRRAAFVELPGNLSPPPTGYHITTPHTLTSIPPQSAITRTAAMLAQPITPVSSLPIASMPVRRRTL